YGVVVRSLPYPNADRIVLIYAENQALGVSRTALTSAEAINSLTDPSGFEYTGYSLQERPLTLVADGVPHQVFTQLVSEDYFSVYGLPPVLGRSLVEGDFLEQRSVAVLNH